MNHSSFRRYSTFLCTLIVLSIAAAERIDRAAEWFVSVSGNDNNPGTQKKPFRTLERARDAVRSRKNRKTEGATVWLTAGRYQRSKTFELTEADSGADGAAVIYKALPGHTAILDGGLLVRPSECKQVTDKSVLARLMPAAQNKVLRIDLAAAGVTEFGKFGPRGFNRGQFPAPAELFINGQPLWIARWPNDSRIPLGKVIDSGSVPRRGEKTKRGAVFHYDTPRAKRWTNADKLYLSGIFGASWADDTIAVAEIDVNKGTIRMAEPHLYGFKNEPFCSWYAVNLLEEIDQPGEYFLDRSAKAMYFLPKPGRIKLVQISQLAAPLVQMTKASHIRLEGLILENARAGGVLVTGGGNNVIAGCTLRLLGGIGIRVNGGRNHRVASCNIYDTGAGGVSLSGGNRKKLTPASHVVENCDIHHVNRWYRTYKPCIQLAGVGHRAAHNHLHHVPGQAILFGGNDHKMEFNEIDHCVTDMSDMGSIYTGRNPSEMGHVIRYNFFHHLDNRLGSGYGVQAIFIDDNDLYTAVIFGNVFYKAGSNAVIKFNGGGGSSIGNNVAIDCPDFVLGGHKKHVDRAIREMRDGRKSHAFARKLLREVDIRTEPFASRYPYLLDSYKAGFNYGTPQWNNVTLSSTDAAAMAQFRNHKLMDFTPKRNAAFLKHKATDVVDRVFGLDHEDVTTKAIPFDKIGLKANQWRKKPPERRSSEPLDQATAESAPADARSAR